MLKTILALSACAIISTAATDAHHEKGFTSESTEDVIIFFESAVSASDSDDVEVEQLLADCPRCPRNPKV